MGFASWVKGLLGGGQSAPGEEEVKGLNFNSVIGAHMKWRRRLADVINGKSTERLNVAQVGAADECTLGKWLKGDEIQKEYGSSSEFQALMREHARFHQSAAEILRQAQSGQKAEAQRLLEQGEFSQLSISVCARLGRLYQGITGNEMAVEEAESDDDEAGGLNFRSVVDAHLAWRKRLTDVIRGVSNEQLSVGQVSADDQCVLGKWLKGPIRDQYANNPEFQALVSEHARFHQCAGQVLQQAQGGQTKEAETMLNGAEFVGLSRSLCTRLVTLHQSLRKA